MPKSSSSWKCGVMLSLSREALDLLLVRLEPTIFTTCCLVSVCSSCTKFAEEGEMEPGLSSEEEDRNVLKLLHR